jgi:hypothetical protein
MTYSDPEVEMSGNIEGRPPAPQEQRAEAFVPGGGGGSAPDGAPVPPADTEPSPVTEGSVPDGKPEIWDRAQADHYRDEWRELQLRFVDNPSGATKQAAALVDDAVQALTASLQQHARAIADQNSANDTDTESQLSALREYRVLFNRLLEL